MTGQYNAKKSWRYYRCNRPQYLNPQPCRRTVGADFIEDAVWQAVSKRLRNPQLIAQEVQGRDAHADSQRHAIDHERECFSRQLRPCDKELKKWESAYIADILTMEDFKAKKDEIETRRTSAQQEIARLDEQQRNLEHAVLITASLREYCAKVRKNLTNSSMNKKQEILAALHLTVVWHPDKLLDMKCSLDLN